MTPEYTRLQRLFPRLISDLIKDTYADGYELTFGEALRTPEQARYNAQVNKTGISNSLHIDRLAIDFEAYKDGKRLTTFDEWLPIGEKWEQMSYPEKGVLCCWGGRFTKLKDYFHFSLQYGGRR